jgi:hypothetical protein
MVDETLQRGCDLRGCSSQVGQLVEHDRPAPSGGPRLAGDAIEEASPVPVLDVGEPREARRDRFGQVAPLDVGRRRVGHRIDAAVTAAPLDEEPRLPEPPPPVDDGETSLGDPHEPVQAGKLLLTVEELHYAG